MRYGAGLAVLVVLCAGCVDLADVDQGVCGNGVVEQGEFCDTFAPEGTACTPPEADTPCAFSCEDAACPDGWACGGDGLCRAASGTFEEVPSTAIIEAVNARVADVDGDGALDVIGDGPAGVQILYGTGTAQFGERSVRPMRPLGQVGLTPRDPPLIVTTNEIGTVAFEVGDDRALRSLAFSSLDTGSSPLRAFAVHFGLSSFTDVFQVTADGICPVGFCDRPELVQPMPSGLGVADLAARIPVGDIQQNALPFDEFVLASQGRASVWLYTTTLVSSQGDLLPKPTLVDTIALPGMARSEPRLYDYDNDGFLDLLILVQTPGGDLHVARANGAAGGLAQTATIEAQFDNLVTDCGASSPWPLAIGELNARTLGGTNRPDFVVNTGVCVFNPLLGFSLAAVPSGGLPFARGVIGDFNGDGNLDAAGVTNNVRGIDVFLATGNGLFNRSHVDTVRPVGALRVGDFDGNFITDIAFLEPVDDANDITILYGSADGPLQSEPVTMARIGSVVDFEPFDLVVPNLQLSTDAITDLGIVFRDGQGNYNGSLFFGDASRSVTSPLVDVNGRPFNTLAGQFDGGTIVLMAEELSGTGYRFSLVGGDTTSFSIGQTWVLPASFTTVHPECSLSVAADLDGDGQDEIALFDGAPAALAPLCQLDPGASSVVVFDSSSPTQMNPANALPWKTPRQLVAGDIDADGSDDVVAVFFGDANTGSRAVVFTGALDAAGGAELPGDIPPVAVALFRQTADSPMQVVVLAADGVWLHSVDASGQVTDSSRAIPVDTPVSTGAPFVVTGDFDGDGLMDMAVNDGALLRVFRAKPVEPGRVSATP